MEDGPGVELPTIDESTGPAPEPELREWAVELTTGQMALPVRAVHLAIIAGAAVFHGRDGKVLQAFGAGAWTWIGLRPEEGAKS